MANALSFLADPEYYKSAANVATGYGNQLADLLKEGKNRITSGRAILTGEPLAESLRNQYFSNDQNALASLAMDWANPVPVSGLVGGIISKGGKAVDALKYSDDVARSVPIFKKYNPPKALGGKFPELKGVERRPNPAVVAVSNDLTIKTLPDGKFQADYSPLYGGGKPFSALGDNPQELMDMAIARVNRSEKAMLQQQKYSSIPNTWKGDAKKVAKNIIDEYGDVSFASSTQSKSKYITLPSGEKIRISDHALPSSYEGADYDFRYGDDVNTLINLIKSGGK